MLHQWEMHSPKKPDCKQCIEAKTKRNTKQVTKQQAAPADPDMLHIGIDLVGPLTADPDGNVWILNAVETKYGIGAAEPSKTKQQEDASRHTKNNTEGEGRVICWDWLTDLA